MKTPFAHFIKKAIKTFAIKTITQFTMIFFINIILSDQKMNKCMINLSSHNLKPTQYVESICQFQYEIFCSFYQSYYIIHATKLFDMELDQNCLQDFFWIKKQTTLQFNRKHLPFLYKYYIFTIFQDKKHLYLQSCIANIGLTVYDSNNKDIHY